MPVIEVIQRVLLGLLPPLLVGLICLYAWAGICYALFRGVRRESEQSCQRFLQRHFLPVSQCPRFQLGLRRVPRAGLVRVGLNGWALFGLPCIVLSAGHLTTWSVVVANAVLFFGGWSFALSWYGRRCLRLLGVDCFEEPAVEASDFLGVCEPVRRQFSWLARFHRQLGLWRQQMRHWLWHHFSEWSGQ